MTSSILDILGDVAYSLGDGYLTVRRKECAEWWVSFSCVDVRDPEHKPTLIDAILDAVRRAAAADQEISFSQYDEHEACKTKLAETQVALDAALKQLGVR